MALRDYQEEAIAQARKAYSERKAAIIVLPTGAGKTRTAFHMVVKSIGNGKRVLWIAHLRELLDQAHGVADEAGLRVGFIAAGYPEDRDAPLQIASIQTLARRELPAADIVIIDEAHHARSATYGRVCDHYKAQNAWLVGLTATPKRLDGRGLGRFFDTIIETTTVRELIERGHLSDYQYLAPYVPDLSGVTIVAGEFNGKQISATMDKSSITGDIVATYRKRADGRKALIFAAGVAHSKNLCAAFTAAGYRAAHLDGATPHAERAKVFAQFKSGEIQILSNAALFIEGIDVCDIGAVILARPTQSLVIHRQSIGRGLRAHPGKSKCIVLDHVGNFLRHGLPDSVVEWDLDDQEKAPAAPKYKRCPACFAVLPSHVAQCPSCGHVFARAPRTGPAAVDGELHEVKVHVWTKEEKHALYDSLLATARTQGYRRGWASRQYRLKTGVWPRGYADLVKSHEAACSHVKHEADGYGRTVCRFCRKEL